MITILSKISIYVSVIVVSLCIPLHVFATFSEISPETTLVAVNEIRVSNGVKPLTVNSSLSKAAQKKGDNMTVYGYWAHTNPKTGETAWNFIQQTGYQYSAAGENLAKKYDTVDKVVQGWLHSPSHRKILLSDKYTETGIAVIHTNIQGKEDALIVQLFAKPILNKQKDSSVLHSFVEQIVQSIISRYI